MDKACGIVAEYNPFHNGHLHCLQEAKRLTGLPVIAVMSGSIMQRGEPAFMDKWTRARLAAICGADLVLELPAAFSLRSAQYFAQSAVSVLRACGIVTALACGVENPGYPFQALAQATVAPQFQTQLRNYLKNGLSYAAAMEKALLAAAVPDDAANHAISLGAAAKPKPLTAFSSPNDILALEYSKALLGTGIAAHYIRRTDSGYNSSDISAAENYASASAIRRACLDGSYTAAARLTPAPVAAMLAKASHNKYGYDERLLWQLLCYRLRLLTPEEIVARCTCSEGLENTLKQLQNCRSLAEALQKASSSRNSASRLRRLLLQLLFDRPRRVFEQQEPAYLRVLAFNEAGRGLLRQIKRAAALPVITKLGRSPWRGQSQAFKEQLKLDIAASDLWALLQEPQQDTGSDYYISPAYIKETILTQKKNQYTPK